jgi:FkbM family methyltransferase
MPFTSYAQNFEDVMLWRAFKLFGPGQYIDVGANHPTRDSVTRSLYERGWRGINIEPVESYYQALCAERPEDVTLCVAIGAAEGELTFYENQETGLSTLSEEMRDIQQAAGIGFVPRTVQVCRLAAICEQYLPAGEPFHFLKIDVEGFEEQVLRGMDFTRFRPWIMLLESPFDKRPEWECLIFEAGYQFAYCDGINRYYVASERPELLPCFSLPPNILDEFQLCRGHTFSHPVENVEQLQAAVTKANQRTNEAETRLHAMQQSRSWRLLHALASLKRRLRQLLRRG